MSKRKQESAPVRADVVDVMVAACEEVRSLGHISMRCARSVECWRCDLTGSVGSDGNRIGEIFEKECGK